MMSRLHATLATGDLGLEKTLHNPSTTSTNQTPASTKRIASLTVMIWRKRKLLTACMAGGADYGHKKSQLQSKKMKIIHCYLGSITRCGLGASHTHHSAGLRGPHYFWVNFATTARCWDFLLGSARLQMHLHSLGLEKR